MGHYGHSRTPGQGQDTGRYPLILSRCYRRSRRVTAMVMQVSPEWQCHQSHRRAESSEGMLLGLLALLALCPTLPYIP